MESTTAAKGFGGALVLGGGGVGVYYASREYSENREEASQEKDTVEITERKEAGTVDTSTQEILVNTLSDDDEYWKVVGEAYVVYALVYSIMGPESVTEIEGDIKSEGITYIGSGYQEKVGGIIKKWCEGTSDKGSSKFKYWCIKRSSRLQEIQEKSSDKSLKTSKDDFDEGDYGSTMAFLREKSLNGEAWRLGDRKDANTKKDEKEALLTWCGEQVYFLFSNNEQEFLNRLESLCFK